jgi:uncharacterized protein (TIGR02246 family)
MGVSVAGEVQSVVVPARAAEAPSAVAQGVATPELEATIRREMDATVKAFNAADPAGLAALFMEKAELVDENGNVYSGRSEITALFKSFFAKFPKAVMAMEVTSVRSIGDSLAVEEGIRQIVAEEGASGAQVRYVAVRDKVGNTWPIASYREFADDPVPTPQEMLQSLAFLEGDWVDESPDGRTAISYRWSEDGNFLLGDYVVSVGGEPVSKSSQRIGWDPVVGVIRSWTFDSDGGFSQGEWTPVDDGLVSRIRTTSRCEVPTGSWPAARSRRLSLRSLASLRSRVRLRVRSQAVSGRRLHGKGFRFGFLVWIGYAVSLCWEVQRDVSNKPLPLVFFHGLLER